MSVKPAKRSVEPWRKALAWYSQQYPGCRQQHLAWVCTACWEEHTNPDRIPHTAECPVGLARALLRRRR